MVHADAAPFVGRDLAMIRKSGICVTSSEIDRDVLGIAAPVFPRAPGSLASLSLVLPLDRADDRLIDKLAQMTMQGARDLEARLGSELRDGM